MTDYRALLQIPASRLDAINAVLHGRFHQSPAGGDVYGPAAPGKLHEGDFGHECFPHIFG